MPARDFYLLTLAELFDAIDGHAQEEAQKREWYLFGVRRQIYFSLALAGDKTTKEEDIIPLEMDEEIREARKKMPLTTLKIDGETDQ
jgi:hypothetical protein